MLKSLFKTRGHSLFFKLLTSFMTIILLLVSFNVISYQFFLSNIQEEIIKNNRLNMSATAENIEKHIKLVKNMGFGMYFNDKAQILIRSSDQINYDIVYQVRKDLQHTLNTSNLYLNNIIYYLVDSGLIIEKDGTTTADKMFSKFYASGQYSLDFWQQELDKPFIFKVYPVAPFVEYNLENEVPKGQLIPVLIKNRYNSSFVILALLDAEPLFQSFHQAGQDEKFYMVDDQGLTLYSNTEEPSDGITLIEPAIHQTYFKKGSYYYFYQRGEESGYGYWSIIPYEKISAQIVRLNVILIALLALAIVIGLSTSIFFTRKFNHPLTRIIRSIEQLQFSAAPRSQIREYDWISDKLSDLMEKNKTINADLSNKNSLLTYYAYIDKLKSIETQVKDIKLPLDKNRPFQLVLFQLTFRELVTRELDIAPNRAAYFIREFIHSEFSRAFKEAFTFQVEKDKILSLLFLDEEGDSELDDSLRSLKQAFDLDRSYCTVTIAVSAQHHEAAAFTPAYERLLTMIAQRKLGEETQVIDHLDERRKTYRLNAVEEQEFTSNLLAGNEAALAPIIRRMLAAMAKKEATLEQFRDFSQEIVNKVLHVLRSMNADAVGRMEVTYSTEQLEQCLTLEQFEKFFDDLLPEVAGHIKQKRMQNDPITGFVTQYVENHYREDISLDLLADKLNITGAYLSTYFKEKRGINFSDYVNTFRMDRAKELLRETDLKIQEVAVQVGYQNVNSFIRIFKKFTGVPPGEFRKESGRM
ncbi:AraC family transcriptional regulator [Paenibacillus sp. J2TS4]|uniref:helix-turn-helix domain-containing protein n=1 Tax=Paenibacillus sp. J2TS4 TaxID=2807194 RepID=UPI001BCBE087|nr:helix-turn-helix domain-containing protein [Paenibacillus sp. J2TS4]